MTYKDTPMRALPALLLSVLCMSVSLGAQSPAGAVPMAAYRLQLSDSVEVQLPFSPEYNETTTVQPDGTISLREVTPVPVAGKTLPEAEAAIAQAYSGLLRAPKVSIILKDFQKASFFATGELARPGRYEVRNNLTLFEAISEAGGLLNERAKRSQIVIFRPQGNGMYESKIVDIKAMLAAKNTTVAYSVLPGDVIYVPQNKFSKIQRYIPVGTLGAYINQTNF